jgi:hypothetical protein
MGCTTNHELCHCADDVTQHQAFPDVSGLGTVRVFRQKVTLEDAIESHACSLEANTRVTNGIPLGSSLLLPVDTVNCVQTLKAHNLLVDAGVATLPGTDFGKGGEGHIRISYVRSMVQCSCLGSTLCSRKVPNPKLISCMKPTNVI